MVMSVSTFIMITGLRFMIASWATRAPTSGTPVTSTMASRPSSWGRAMASGVTTALPARMPSSAAPRFSATSISAASRPISP